MLLVVCIRLTIIFNIYINKESRNNRIQLIPQINNKKSDIYKT